MGESLSSKPFSRVWQKLNYASDPMLVHKMDKARRKEKIRAQINLDVRNARSQLYGVTWVYANVPPDIAAANTSKFLDEELQMELPRQVLEKWQRYQSARDMYSTLPKDMREIPGEREHDDRLDASEHLFLDEDERHERICLVYGAVQHQRKIRLGTFLSSPMKSVAGIGAEVGAVALSIIEPRMMLPALLTTGAHYGWEYRNTRMAHNDLEKRHKPAVDYYREVRGGLADAHVASGTAAMERDEWFDGDNNYGVVT